MSNIHKMLFIAFILFCASSRLLTKNEDGTGEDDDIETDSQVSKVNNPEIVTKAEDQIQSVVDENANKQKPADQQEIVHQTSQIIEGEKKPTTNEEADQKANKSRAFIFVGLGIVILGAGILGAAYFLKKKSLSE